MASSVSRGDRLTLEEVGLDEDVEEVSGQACKCAQSTHESDQSSRSRIQACRPLTLDAVVKGQDVDPLAVLDVVAWVDGGDISELYSQVVPSHWGWERSQEVSNEARIYASRGGAAETLLTLVELNLALIDIVG